MLADNSRALRIRVAVSLPSSALEYSERGGRGTTTAARGKRVQTGKGKLSVAFRRQAICG